MDMDSAVEKQITDLVYGFFAEECEVEPDSITLETNVIEDLEGDSLLLLSLLETVCKTFNLTVQLRTLGKHLMKQPANTIGEILALTKTIVERGDDIVNVDL